MLGQVLLIKEDSKADFNMEAFGDDAAAEK
jgi:hypothetical protein